MHIAEVDLKIYKSKQIKLTFKPYFNDKIDEALVVVTGHGCVGTHHHLSVNLIKSEIKASLTC
jgi:hypothetical protein